MNVQIQISNFFLCQCHQVVLRVCWLKWQQVLHKKVQRHYEPFEKQIVNGCMNVGIVFFKCWMDLFLTYSDATGLYSF